MSQLEDEQIDWSLTTWEGTLVAASVAPTNQCERTW